MRVRQAPETSVSEQILAFFLYDSLATLALSLLPLALLGRPSSRERLITLTPWLVLVAIGFLAPAMCVVGLLGFPCAGRKRSSAGNLPPTCGYRDATAVGESSSNTKGAR
jgi:hypothetical protein